MNVHLYLALIKFVLDFYNAPRQIKLLKTSYRRGAASEL